MGGKPDFLPISEPSRNDEEEDGSANGVARQKFHFVLKAGDLLEPNYFIRDKPTLNLREYKKLSPFLSQQITARGPMN